MFVGKVIRQRTHFLKSARALVIRKIQVGINAPEQPVGFATVGGVVTESVVAKERLETQVLKVLAHVISRNMANVKVKTHKLLGAPAEFFKLKFLKIATVKKCAVKGATLLSNSTDEVNFAEANPVALNHFFAQFTILLKRGRLGGARSTEVAKD